MLYAYTDTTQAIAEGGVVIFNTNGIQTGCVATHQAGTGAVDLNRPGFYMVHFNADASDTAIGEVELQLYQNGIAIPGAKATTYIAVADGIANLGFTALVRVAGSTCPCDTTNMQTTITVRNIGVDANLNNAAITVTKIA